MKILCISIILSLLCQLITLAQTPEHQKEIDAAKRKTDSIMNLPHVKEMMEKAKVLQIETDDQIEKQKALKQKSKQTALVRAEPKGNSSKNNSKDDFYWRNTIESSANAAFKNWSHGKAELKATYYDIDMERTEVVIGEITESGEVKFYLPSFNDARLLPIERSFFESERTLERNMTYSNIKTPYISFRFTTDVYKGTQRIGTLKMGNTIKPVVNLNAPCCMDKGHKGYFAYWIYVGENCTITHNKATTLKTTTGSDAGSINYNLQLKRGWNLVKIAIKDNYLKYQDEASSGSKYLAAKTTEYSASSTIPKDVKYYFTKETY